MIRTTSIRYSDSKTKFVVQRRGDDLIIQKTGAGVGLHVEEGVQGLRDLAAFLNLVADDVTKGTV